MLETAPFGGATCTGTRRYDRIVSIGSNCEVTWNLRNHFEISEAYPFDWWVTPYHALLALLDANFGGLFELENLVVTPDRRTVVDKRLNILHQHDFPRDEQGFVDVDGFAGQIPALREKFAYLAARFVNDLSGKEVLFIRNRCGNDPKYLVGDYGDLQPAQCVEICDRLKRLLPNTKFDIFATNKPGFEPFTYRDSNIFSDCIVDYRDSDDYMVSPKGWSEMFVRNQIELGSGR
jgi:hypothetical protein